MRLKRKLIKLSAYLSPVTTRPISSKQIKLKFTRQTSQQRCDFLKKSLVLLSALFPSPLWHACLASRMRSIPDSRSSLPSTHWRHIYDFSACWSIQDDCWVTIWIKRICFLAKLSPTFGSFGSALIGALSMSILRQCCLPSFGGYLQFDAHQQSFLGRPLLHISLMISAASESPFKLLCANGSVAALIVSVITDEARDGPDAAIRAAHRSLRDLSRFSPQFDWNFSREALDPIFS